MYVCMYALPPAGRRDVGKAVLSTPGVGSYNTTSGYRSLSSSASLPQFTFGMKTTGVQSQVVDGGIGLPHGKAGTGPPFPLVTAIM
jgi:hypothetical protein